MILRWLTPKRYVDSVLMIAPAHLVAEGIRGVILDLDNTVVAWDAAAPAPEVRLWMRTLRDAGVHACIVSNNFTGRAQAIGRLLDIPAVAGAVKPTPWAFRRAMALMGTRADQTALIGDQLFTDVLGGNLLGLYTILVEPLTTQEFPTTKLVRRLERFFRARLLRSRSRPADAKEGGRGA